MIDLSKMKGPSDKRYTWREGIIQIHITTACDFACTACHHASNLALTKPNTMTVEQFTTAIKSLDGYFGVYGVFGGNPCIHPQFEEICRILAKYVPFEQRGLFSNNLNGHGKLCREIFNPEYSNLNVHCSSEAEAEMRRDWPECHPKGLTDSRHSPPFVAMRDMIDLSRDQMERLIESCDVNQVWSPLIGLFRGELRAWFCEMAATQSEVHQWEPDYPDTGLPVISDWWRKPLSEFKHQIDKHCFDCGMPLRGMGDLAVSGTKEYVSETHKSILKFKRPGSRVINLVDNTKQLHGHVKVATDYIENGTNYMENKEVKILIGVITAEMVRRADFYDYFNMLEKPAGTGIAFIHGQSPARGRNMIIEQALEHDFTHVLFVDDDVAFSPDAMMKLLAHNKDIVSGLYLMRNYPHHPIMFDEALDDGRCFTHYLSDGESGLVKIVAAGAGFLLIKTEVLRKMIPFCPGKLDKTCWFTLGELENDHWCDDIAFFKHARAAGIDDMWVDLSCIIGHMAQVTVWPNPINGKWQTTYDTKGAQTISAPQITMDEVLAKREEVKQQELANVG